MKIKVTLSNNLSGFDSRDIRNFIGSIADEKDKDFVMYHGKGLSPVIYSKPYRNIFEITFAKSDKESIDVIGDLANKLNSGNFVCYGEKINKVDVSYDNYLSFADKKEMVFYKSRTPFVLGVNNTEYKILFNVSQKSDKTDFIKYLKRRIIDSVIFQAKEYLNSELPFDLLDKIEIYFQNQNNQFVFKNIKYKDKILPVMYLSFISNYRLPEFLGYKMGLGFGQISNVI
ncbi:MAG: hypothetical protein EVJ48_01365 [Candidatus Acidulodesulfobacterium acidiphilum]|uniref:Uncharacterized protein n=1 Tax=Candidatus Acidulodesulfobacterium acidiphilum TaxID=2597224 RepID=A0A520XGC7_9DELT|nr:MAG: hypothetical protein EVJ48_01365 [Candidatus Acidulodesulfobacterium acidiphilum]